MSDRQRLRELALTLRDDLGLKGRWFWTGEFGRNIHLATRAGGQMDVLGFARMGMASAQPTFPHRPDGAPYGWLHKAMQLPRFEVCPDAIDPKDDRVYRKTLNGIKTPVAEYLAAVDAETVLELLDEIDGLRERLGLADWSDGQ